MHRTTHRLRGLSCSIDLGRMVSLWASLVIPVLLNTHELSDRHTYVTDGGGLLLYMLFEGAVKQSDTESY